MFVEHPENVRSKRLDRIEIVHLPSSPARQPLARFVDGRTRQRVFHF